VCSSHAGGQDAPEENAKVLNLRDAFLFVIIHSPSEEEPPGEKKRGGGEEGKKKKEAKKIRRGRASPLARRGYINTIARPHPSFYLFCYRRAAQGGRKEGGEGEKGNAAHFGGTCSSPQS